MKKLLTATLLGIILFSPSCSNSNNNNNCPSVITNALGNYESFGSSVTVNSGSTNLNPIYVQVVNSISCDYVDLKLTGAINTTIRAKFSNSFPYQGDYFTIPVGQTIQYNGMTFTVKSNQGNGVFFRENEITLGITNAFDNSNTEYLQITVAGNKI